jgi:hypothetical protein
MSTVQTHCTICTAPVDLEPAEVLVLTGTEPSATGTFLFQCAVCQQVIVKSASPANLALLAAAGATVGEPGAPATRPNGRPFTRNDLLDFHMLLASGDRLIPLVLGAKQ